MNVTLPQEYRVTINIDDRTLIGIGVLSVALIVFGALRGRK